MRIQVNIMDGLECFVKNDKLELFNKICREWEEKTKYTLEEDEYSKIIMSTVNDYIAITSSGKIKKKGDFISEYELWKNKSWRVVSLALEEYFIKGTNPIEFITNHKNIYDFCLMARASGDLYLEIQNSISGETRKLKKLVRYYLTTDKEWQLYKRGIGSTGKLANISLHADNDLGKIYIQYFNQFKEMEDYKIDYSQYVLKCLKIIDNVEKSNKLKSYINSLNQSSQLSLF